MIKYIKPYEITPEIDGADTYTQFGLFQHEIDEAKEKIVAWLKQPHTTEQSSVVAS